MGTDVPYMTDIRKNMTVNKNVFCFLTVMFFGRHYIPNNLRPIRYGFKHSENKLIKIWETIHD